MNNILTFEDYKKMNIRQVEHVIYRQFIEEDINDEVNEGIIRNAINKASGKFIQKALSDEIEKGKELEKSIKEALDGLNKGFEEIKKYIKGNKKNDSKLASIEKVKDAIKSVQSQTFDTLTMIGSEGEIDFAGFMGSATISAAANFGILFSPIRSLFITRKAYKYFLGIIKQTIRRNLLIIQLNFDQFENLILQKSFESNDDSELMTMNSTLSEIISAMQTELCGKDSILKKITGRKHEEMKKYLSNFQKVHTELIKNRKENNRSNPYASLWQDQYNNTYTRTLEQIKQYINDDSQRELDALKNSITKMAGNDVELLPYGELLISAAEEYAIKTNHGINNNFIKMSSVFNLENQKKLIDLIVATQKENEEAMRKSKEKIDLKEQKKKLKKDIKDGKKIYENNENTLKKTKYSYENFEQDFGDDIDCLRAFLKSDEGKDKYDELLKTNNLLKYYIEDALELNNLLESLNNLQIVEVSEQSDFYDKIVNKSQTLYHLMAEKSIQDAIKSTKSDKYFGFKINDDDVDNTTHKLKDDFIDSNYCVQLLSNAVNIKRKGKNKYFLTFNTDHKNSLFNILHKEFKTKIFNGDNTYISDISTESKEDIFKIIYKNFNFGNTISSKIAKYLVILEAQMLLINKDPWFVVKDNDELKGCFKPNSSKILNKNAFVEINIEDYNDINNFLTKIQHILENDFIDDLNKNKRNSK